MGELLGEQNHPRLVFGGTHTLNVPPFLFGYQCFSLLVLGKIKEDLPMKKAAKWSNLAAFEQGDGLASIERCLETTINTRFQIFQIAFVPRFVPRY